MTNGISGSTPGEAADNAVNDATSAFESAMDKLGQRDKSPEFQFGSELAEVPEFQVMDDIGGEFKGGGGSDAVYGGAGADTIKAGSGADVVAGRGGDDAIDGATGNDLLDGGKGNDTIRAGVGNDIVYGGEGDDRIWTGSGQDYVDAGAGNDIIRANGAGDKVINGGEGDDTVVLGRNVDLESLGKTQDGDIFFRTSDGSIVIMQDVEFVKSERGEIVSADDVAITEKGDTGDSNIEGGNKNDDLRGGNGADTLSGGNGDDTISGGAGSDVLSGGDGADLIRTGSGKLDQVDAGSGDDAIVVNGTGDKAIDGGDGHDRVELGGGVEIKEIKTGEEGEQILITANGDTITMVNVEEVVTSDGGVVNFEEGRIVTDLDATNSRRNQDVTVTPEDFNNNTVDGTLSVDLGRGGGDQITLSEEFGEISADDISRNADGNIEVVLGEGRVLELIRVESLKVGNGEPIDLTTIETAPPPPAENPFEGTARRDTFEVTPENFAEFADEGVLAIDGKGGRDTVDLSALPADAAVEITRVGETVFVEIEGVGALELTNVERLALPGQDDLEYLSNIEPEPITTDPANRDSVTITPEDIAENSFGGVTLVAGDPNVFTDNVKIGALLEPGVDVDDLAIAQAENGDILLTLPDGEILQLRDVERVTGNGGIFLISDLLAGQA